jgi:DNA-binding transcriptional ArsR family regulator
MSEMCDKVQQLGKGIGSPARYHILEYLMGGSRSVGDIVEKIGLSQPAVSQHLATLKACGLVDNVKMGQEVYYTLDTRHMLEVLKHLTSGIEKCKSLKNTSKSAKSLVMNS